MSLSHKGKKQFALFFRLFLQFRYFVGFLPNFVSDVETICLKRYLCNYFACGISFYYLNPSKNSGAKAVPQYITWCIGFLNDCILYETGLSEKQELQLTLLVEETLGIPKGILGFTNGMIFVENEDKKYTVHFEANIHMGDEEKAKFITVSTKKKNSHYKGFKGMLQMIADRMISDIKIERDKLEILVIKNL